MKPAWRHAWDVTPQQAVALQDEARRRVILRDDSAAFSLPPRLVATDVGYDLATNLCLASLVVWDTAQNREAAHLVNVQPATFPYVPGLLSFREIPALLPLFERLDFTPELLLCDGQGIAHPRRIGLAAHLGVLLDLPALGWAKSLLCGHAEGELPVEGGSAVPLIHRREQIGWVFRSRTGTLPTFVSPGHRMTLERSLELARALRGRYRICDPARRAHELTRELLARVRAGELG